MGAIALAAAGLSCVLAASWIDVKARVAQLLIARAWNEEQQGQAHPSPWPWADTLPVARLIVPRRTAPDGFIVLEGSSGRNLAFGPTHDPATVLPGERGNSVIAGHRDTHFRFLRGLRDGDLIGVQRPHAAVVWFAVTQTAVVDSRHTRIALDSDEPRLTLVTCYPFDAVVPGGPLRYVVTAARVARQSIPVKANGPA